MENATPAPVNFADCYVLTNKRTKTFITEFLNTFLPNRHEATTQCEVPQFSQHPTATFYSAAALICYLEKHHHERHAIYWLNRDVSTLRGAMCIFTSDGQLIVGLYCETLRPDTHIEKSFLNQLVDFCSSANGLIEYEQPAPEDTSIFMQRLKAYRENNPV